jgi:hypothetical protein
MRFQDKIAIVIGGASGIGKEVATRFAKSGIREGFGICLEPPPPNIPSAIGDDEIAIQVCCIINRSCLVRDWITPGEALLDEFDFRRCHLFVHFPLPFAI